MTVRASLSAQIDALVADLSGVSDVKREAAVARLAVIGARAVARLVQLGESGASPLARAAGFRALEAIGDVRGLEAALRAAGDRDAPVAVAAIGVARAFIRGRHSVRVVDRLSAVALDQRRPDAVRVAAVRALRDLDAATVAPLLRSLSRDRSDAVKAEVAANQVERPPADAAAALARFVEQPLPDEPEAMRSSIIAAADSAPLPLLLAVLERIRDREDGEPKSRRTAWTAARAAAHLGLARRDSRLGLYDLRESLERSREPLPLDMLAALSLVGDASCLDAIATARARSTDEWWRDHLTRAFDAIVARERLSARHAVMRKIRAKYGREGQVGREGRERQVGQIGRVGRVRRERPEGQDRRVAKKRK